MRCITSVKWVIEGMSGVEKERQVSAQGVLQMQGGGGEGVLLVLRAPDNAADTVLPEQIRKIQETVCR